MLRVNASIAKPVSKARKMVTRMKHILRYLNVKTVEIVMLLTARNVPFLKRNLTFNLSECIGISNFLKLSRFTNIRMDRR